MVIFKLANFCIYHTFINLNHCRPISFLWIFICAFQFYLTFQVYQSKFMFIRRFCIILFDAEIMHLS